MSGKNQFHSVICRAALRVAVGTALLAAADSQLFAQNQAQPNAPRANAINENGLKNNNKDEDDGFEQVRRLIAQMERRRSLESAAQTFHVDVEPTGDLLRLADGSELHGKLAAFEPGGKIAWAYPGSSQPARFPATNVSLVRFASAENKSLAPTCAIRLYNGDEISAELTSLNWDAASMNTWFGGAVSVPRSAIQSIVFLPKGSSIDYDGPDNPTNWASEPKNVWITRDGTFYSHGVGILGWDAKLSGSATIEFDLASSVPFDLLFRFYSDKAGNASQQRTTPYFVRLTPGQVSVQRQNGPGADLGSAKLPILTRDGSIHFAFQCDKETKSLTVLADGKLARRWQDETGFISSGSCINIIDNAHSSGTRISGVRVSHWPGNAMNVGESAQTNQDTIWLANRDRAAGKVTGIEGENVVFKLGEREIKIPMSRITRIEFAAAAVVAPKPGEVCASLAGGTRLLLQVDQWNDANILAHSALWGSLKLNSSAVRQLDFKPGSPASGASMGAPIDEFGGLDD